MAYDKTCAGCGSPFRTPYPGKMFCTRGCWYAHPDTRARKHASGTKYNRRRREDPLYRLWEARLIDCRREAKERKRSLRKIRLLWGVGPFAVWRYEEAMRTVDYSPHNLTSAEIRYWEAKDRLDPA